MRDGARHRLELEEHGRSPLVWVAIGCVIMFFVAIGLFIMLAGARPDGARPAADPPGETR